MSQFIWFNVLCIALLTWAERYTAVPIRTFVNWMSKLCWYVGNAFRCTAHVHADLQLQFEMMDEYDSLDDVPCYGNDKFINKIIISSPITCTLDTIHFFNHASMKFVSRGGNELDSNTPSYIFAFSQIWMSSSVDFYWMMQNTILCDFLNGQEKCHTITSSSTSRLKLPTVYAVSKKASSIIRGRNRIEHCFHKICCKLFC